MQHEQLRYKIKIFLQPNWEEWISNLSQKVNISYDEYRDYFINNKNLNVNFQESLFQRELGFTVFDDKGMEQIWSIHEKDFVDRIEVKGQMFACGFKNEMTLCDSKYKEAIQHLIIAPNEFGFKSFVERVDRERIFSEIPFSKIVSFFKDLYKNEGNWACQCAIKFFPGHLVSELEKCDVKYNKSFRDGNEGDFNYKNLELCSNWTKDNHVEVYDERLIFHQFDALYYSLLIKFDFYD